MRKHLQPDALFSSFDEITPVYLTERKIKLLFCDVDNTLAPYEVPEPDEFDYDFVLIFPAGHPFDLPRPRIHPCQKCLFVADALDPPDGVFFGIQSAEFGAVVPIVCFFVVPE